eukprot:7231217-Heterocapsa_arctica.AAC.1
MHGSRVLSLCDNMSCLMALVKGRGGNPALQCLCRRAASLQIGAELRWAIRYIESERNGTDFDSRAGDRGELRAGQTVQGPTDFMMNFQRFDSHQVLSGPAQLRAVDATLRPAAAPAAAPLPSEAAGSAPPASRDTTKKAAAAQPRRPKTCEE